MGDHGHDVPAEGCEDTHRAVARTDRDADADAGEGGEERVRERGEDAPHDEQADGATDPSRLAVLAHVGRGQVEDVLGEREPDADHAGVHQSVEHAVELVGVGRAAAAG